MGKGISSITIGIDEAGRGPVIGDLLLVIIGFNTNDLSHLETMGVRDSKELSPITRKKLFKKILEYSLIIYTASISPRTIDRFNINKIIYEQIVQGLTILSKILNPYNNIKIIIDEIKGYDKKLRNKIYSIFANKNIDVIIEPHADKNYVAVSAASIVAKYIRDENISVLKHLYGEMGSGYPSDQKTINWIKQIYETLEVPPPFIRLSWATLKKIAPTWYSGSKHKTHKTIFDYLGKGGRVNGNKPASRSEG